MQRLRKVDIHCCTCGVSWPGIQVSGGKTACTVSVDVMVDGSMVYVRPEWYRFLERVKSLCNISANVQVCQSSHFFEGLELFSKSSATACICERYPNLGAITLFTQTWSQCPMYSLLLPRTFFASSWPFFHVFGLLFVLIRGY